MSENPKTYGIKIGYEADFGKVSIDLFVDLPVGSVLTPNHPAVALKRALQDCVANFAQANKAES